VNRVIENITRADRMIFDLLDVSRIKAGERLPLKIQNLDIQLLIQQTLQDLTTIYGDRFVFHSQPKIRGNWSPHDIRRLIENLASNAVKYGYPNTPIQVRLKQSGGYVQIEVHNEGNPLDKKNLVDLFEPFYRGATAQRSGKRGWGLGLTLVRGITEAHGGKIDVESDSGRGTTFRIILPTDHPGGIVSNLTHLAGGSI
jgi:signal transduction histidine kinase